MFTGIITHTTTLRAIEVRGTERRFVVDSPFHPDSINLGASIAHNGCCLTVVEKGTDAQGHFYALDVSPHTLEHTTLGSWSLDTLINLERALSAGDELGGHIVSGHVDALAYIRGITHEGDSVHYEMDILDDLAGFVATKGSVTLDGVSLTVTWAKDSCFGLTLIPHTLQHTNWQSLQVGDALNCEVDMLARYVARMLEVRGQ